MTTKSNRKLLLVGGFVFVALCLAFAIVVGAGVFLWNLQPVRTATPPVLRGLTVTPSVRPTKRAIPMPQDQAACLAQGGRWARIGLGPREECNLPTPDAGSVCADSSECAGLCLADLSSEQRDRVTRQRASIETKGKCAAWHITVGCIAVVENGQVKNILCID